MSTFFLMKFLIFLEDIVTRWLAIKRFHDSFKIASLNKVMFHLLLR